MRGLGHIFTIEYKIGYKIGYNIGYNIVQTRVKFFLRL